MAFSFYLDIIYYMSSITSRGRYFLIVYIYKDRVHTRGSHIMCFQTLGYVKLLSQIFDFIVKLVEIVLKISVRVWI